jgi:hypothetical protein
VNLGAKYFGFVGFWTKHKVQRSFLQQFNKLLFYAFVLCTPLQIFEWSNQEEWDGQDM